MNNASILPNVANVEVLPIPIMPVTILDSLEIVKKNDGASVKLRPQMTTASSFHNPESKCGRGYADGN